MAELAINRETISANYNRLRGHIRKTPTVEVDPSDFDAQVAQLQLKLEHIQLSGSFKARGAFTHFLLRGGTDAGVVAASGGNHGAAVACAAQRLGKKATIFVPSIASPAKTAAITEYGADLNITGEAYADAFRAATTYVNETGAVSVHAYDQPETLVGQGSIALELEAQAPGLTTLLVAVGGGGLIGGISAWFQGRIKLIAVEPETATTLKSAMDAGEPVDVPVSGVAADSLGAKRLGRLAFPLCQSYVEDVVTVRNCDITRAQELLWRKTRVLAEPGGATALAALVSGAYKPQPDERVGVIVCGGNTHEIPAG